MMRESLNQYTAVARLEKVRKGGEISEKGIFCCFYDKPT